MYCPWSQKQSFTVFLQLGGFRETSHFREHFWRSIHSPFSWTLLAYHTFTPMFTWRGWLTRIHCWFKIVFFGHRANFNFLYGMLCTYHIDTHQFWTILEFVGPFNSDETPEKIDSLPNAIAAGVISTPNEGLFTSVTSSWLRVIRVTSFKQNKISFLSVFLPSNK